MRRLQSRILIGQQASEHTRATLGPIDDRLLNVFERCFTTGRRMDFDYIDRNGAPTSRRIECVALVHNAPAWYIVSWDQDKQAPRMFRMDRMSAPVCGDRLDTVHPLAEVRAIACPDAESAFDEFMGTPIG